jgi:hypothetical protein
MKTFLVFVLSLFIASCSLQQPNSLTTTATASPPLIALPTKVMASATSSPTSVPSSTQTLTPMPTWTSLPTINPKIGKETLYTWLEGSDNCRLPCWAGIVPGKSRWEEAQQLLQPMNSFSEMDISVGQDCTFSKCNEIAWSLPSDLNTHGYVYSKLEENKIHLVLLQVVDPNLVKALNLRSILKQYGKPAIILFSAEPDLPGDLFLELILVYPDNQFIIKYSKYAKLSNSQVVSCGQDSVIQLIILDNKEPLMSVDKIARTVETEHLHIDSWRKPVEVATGLTINEFYETFSKANAPCITTPIKVWQP